MIVESRSKEKIIWFMELWGVEGVGSTHSFVEGSLA
jgi:hypothetical protein